MRRRNLTCLLLAWAATVALVGCGEPQRVRRPIELEPIVEETTPPAVEEPVVEEPEPVVTEEPVVEEPEPEVVEEPPVEEPEPAVEEGPAPEGEFEALEDLVAAITEATAAAKPLVLLDGPAGFARWSTVEWANPAETRLVNGEGADGQWVAVERQQGDRDKWVVTLAQPADLSAYGLVSVEVRAADAVSVALGIWTGAEQLALFESKARAVKPDTWQTITVPLKAAEFKCEASNWAFTAEIADTKDVGAISLFFYGEGAEPVLFRNLRVVKAD